MMNAKEHLRKLQAKVDTLSGISASAEKDVAATDGGDRDINTDAARATRLRAKLLEHVNATGDFATWSLYVGRDGLLVEDLPGRVQRLMDANNTMGNLDFGKGARRGGVYLAALVVAFGFLVVYGCVLNMQVYATVGTVVANVCAMFTTPMVPGMFISALRTGSQAAIWLVKYIMALVVKNTLWLDDHSATALTELDAARSPPRTKAPPPLDATEVAKRQLLSAAMREVGDRRLKYLAIVWTPPGMSAPSPAAERSAQHIVHVLQRRARAWSSSGKALLLVANDVGSAALKGKGDAAAAAAAAGGGGGANRRRDDLMSRLRAQWRAFLVLAMSRSTAVVDHQDAAKQVRVALLTFGGGDGGDGDDGSGGDVHLNVLPSIEVRTHGVMGFPEETTQLARIATREERRCHGAVHHPSMLSSCLEKSAMLIGGLNLLGMMAMKGRGTKYDYYRFVAEQRNHIRREITSGNTMLPSILSNDYVASMCLFTNHAHGVQLNLQNQDLGELYQQLPELLESLTKDVQEWFIYWWNQKDLLQFLGDDARCAELCRLTKRFYEVMRGGERRELRGGEKQQQTPQTHDESGGPLERAYDARQRHLKLMESKLTGIQYQLLNQIGYGKYNGSYLSRLKMTCPEAQLRQRIIDDWHTFNSSFQRYAKGKGAFGFGVSTPFAAHLLPCYFFDEEGTPYDRVDLLRAFLVVKGFADEDDQAFVPAPLAVTTARTTTKASAGGGGRGSRQRRRTRRRRAPRTPRRASAVTRSRRRARGRCVPRCASRGRSARCG